MLLSVLCGAKRQSIPINECKIYEWISILRRGVLVKRDTKKKKKVLSWTKDMMDSWDKMKIDGNIKMCI